MNDIQSLIDTIPLIKFRLRNFKKVNNNLWNFSCPICMDSEKVKSKARGYIYKNQFDKDLWYKCHNCSYHKKYKWFLKDFDDSLYKEIFIQQYIDRNKKKIDIDMSITSSEIEEYKVLPKDEYVNEGLLFSMVTPIYKLNKEHPALQYIISRKIPFKRMRDIYYIDNINHIEQLSEKYTDKLKEGEGRICLPYRNISGKIIGMSLRSLQPNHPIKYIHLKFVEKYPLLFNIENINIHKRVFVTEGQIDSMFFENGIAASGSNFSRVKEYFPLDQTVYIHDNEPRHKDTIKAIEKSIVNGYRVTLLPETIKAKDVNQMILNNELSIHDLNDIFYDNSYTGLEAMLKFEEWKKI